MSDFLFASLLFGIFALIFTISLVSAHFEAKEFNRCTGGNASLITALFTELRIENCDR